MCGMPGRILPHLRFENPYRGQTLHPGVQVRLLWPSLPHIQYYEKAYAQMLCRGFSACAVWLNLEIQIHRQTSVLSTFQSVGLCWHYWVFWHKWSFFIEKNYGIGQQIFLHNRGCWHNWGSTVPLSAIFCTCKMLGLRHCWCCSIILHDKNAHFAPEFVNYFAHERWFILGDVCNVCGYSGSSRNDIVRHIEAEHMNVHILKMAAGKTSAVWNFFDPSVYDKKMAICKLCTKGMSLGSEIPKMQTLSNCKRHIQKMHPEHWPTLSEMLRSPSITYTNVQ